VTAPTLAPRLLLGLSEIADGYDGCILDLWGVLHDGAKPYPGAVETLRRLKDAGKRIAILSNAPRRVPAVIERITVIGIPPDSYDFVFSSGEEAWQNLRRRDDPFYAALGHRCFHIGVARDDNLIEGVGIEKVARLADADFIMVSGPWDWNDGAQSFDPLLEEALARGLPLVCANADLVVMHRAKLMICAGAIAERYEAMGGRVRWHGKPFPSVYAACFAHLGIADRRRILAVGDSLRTDIAGAAGVGIDSLFITGGIHAGDFADGDALGKMMAASQAPPQFVLPRFVW
jgi:HAD superfamily hydrolase (TIGR01459 family)